MAAKVPWNTPGGAKCCCDCNCSIERLQELDIVGPPAPGDLTEPGQVYSYNQWKNATGSSFFKDGTPITPISESDYLALCSGGRMTARVAGNAGVKTFAEGYRNCRAGDPPCGANWQCGIFDRIREVEAQGSAALESWWEFDPEKACFPQHSNAADSGTVLRVVSGGSGPGFTMGANVLAQYSITTHGGDENLRGQDDPPFSMRAQLRAQVSVLRLECMGCGGTASAAVQLSTRNEVDPSDWAIAGNAYFNTGWNWASSNLSLKVNGSSFQIPAYRSIYRGNDPFAYLTSCGYYDTRVEAVSGSISAEFEYSTSAP